MSRLFNCELYKAATSRKKVAGKFNEETRSYIDKRVAQIMSDMKALRSGLNPKGNVQRSQEIANFYERLRQVGNLSDVVMLDPSRAKGIDTFLARNFAITQQGIDSGIRTASGWVREQLVNTGRIFKGELHDYLATSGVIHTISEESGKVKSLLTDAGLTADEISEVMADSTFFSWHKYIHEYEDVGASAITYSQAQYREYLSFLKDELGLSDDVVNQVLESGYNITKVYNDLYYEMRRLGVNVDAMKNAGYSPVVYSKEALRQFDYKKVDVGQYLDNTMSRISADTAFMKSRVTDSFILEDEILLDYILTARDPEFFSKLGVDGVPDLLENGPKLAEALVEKIPDDVMDDLIATGVVSKLPTPNREVFKLMVKAHNLPYEGLSELMAADYLTAFKSYKHTLEKLVTDSGYVHQLVSGMLKEGWGVSEHMRQLEPQKYERFVPMKDVLPPQVFARYGLDRTTTEGIMGVKSSVLSNLNSTYVHPIVADLLSAQMELATSPTKISVLANVVQKINSVFKRLAVATDGFMQRQLYNAQIQLFAATGGNILSNGASLGTMMKMIAELKYGDGVWAKQNKIYQHGSEMLTEYELIRALRKRGFLDEMNTPFGELASHGYYATNPLTVRRNIRNIRHMAQQFPGMEGVLYTANDLAEGFDRAVSKVSQPFQVANTLFEQSARLESIKAQLYRGKTAMLNAPFKQSTTVDEAVEHASKYFFMYDDLGVADKMIGSYVIPFWGWQSRNTLSQTRHMLRHPVFYANWNRLHAALSQPVRNDDNFTEGEVPQWLEDSASMYWKDAEGNYYGLPLTSIDPIKSYQKEILQPLAQTFGVVSKRKETTQGQVDDIREQYLGENQTDKFLSGLLAKTYPVTKTLVARSTGINPETGQKFSNKDTTFLGMEMSPLTKYTIANLLPSLRMVDSIVKPDDPLTKKVESYNPWRLAGLSYQQIDTLGQLGLNEGQMKSTVLDMVRALKAKRQEYVTITDPSKRLLSENEMLGLETAAKLLYNDILKIGYYRQQKGIATTKQLKNEQRAMLIQQALKTGELNQQQRAVAEKYLNDMEAQNDNR